MTEKINKKQAEYLGRAVNHDRQIHTWGTQFTHGFDTAKPSHKKHGKKNKECIPVCQFFMVAKPNPFKCDINASSTT